MYQNRSYRIGNLMYFCQMYIICQKQWFGHTPMSFGLTVIFTIVYSSFSSRSSAGNSSLLDESGSTSWVLQAAIELADYGSVVWPDSHFGQLIEGAGLQQMFCFLTASTTRALLCVAKVEFRIQVIAEVVLACPEPEHRHLFPSS